MSVIFGIHKSTAAEVPESEMLELARATERFASDGVSIRTSGRVGMGFQPYYTHARSKLDFEPATDAFGNLLAFDGRLDNYQDLGQQLDLDVGSVSDSNIVLAAFLRWGERCFSRFVGDWAIALWVEDMQSLYLARDHAGSRTLYFQTTAEACRWSTYLDSFFINGTALSLDDDYVACYLACEPTQELTPYKGLKAVPPAHYLVIRNNSIVTNAHWDWRAPERLVYQTDREYEEHFFSLLGQSIGRRTVPGAPVLAQLSGGVDSASIVCTSDFLRRRNDADAEIIGTISYFDDSEPSWDEKPYFMAVEKHRSKAGSHVRISFADRTFAPVLTEYGGYLLPGADSSALIAEERLNEVYSKGDFRCILSGLGGDELLGGVPTPTPELATYLFSGDIRRLLAQSFQWSLASRSPIIETLFATAKYSIDLYRRPRIAHGSLPPWICTDLLERCLYQRAHDSIDCRSLRMSPQSICNGLTWRAITETLPHAFPWLMMRLEYRYPYLDRDLVDFLLRVPREQLVRPGRRRSMMRRALTNIVPAVVLERRRKAFQIRTPLCTIQHAYSQISDLFSESLLGQYGYIDPVCFRSALLQSVKGIESQWWRSVLKTIMLELWLTTHLTGRSSTNAIPQTHRSLLLRC